MRYIATRENVSFTSEVAKKYMDYIAMRPGTHGLFGAETEVDIKALSNELEKHEGHVWTLIFSLHREDACRLGFDNADSWRSLIMQYSGEMACAMKIPSEHLRWYAAFHDEAHHPHIHMMVWSDEPKHGYLTYKGIEQIRSKLTNVIFKDELYNLYVKKDMAYKDLTSAAADTMRRYIEKMEMGYDPVPVIENKMRELTLILNKTPGKHQYGYMKKAVKALVDEIVDELARVPEVSACYDEWNKLRDELESYYKQSPREHLPLSKQKEFRAIKNMVIREADAMRNEKTEQREGYHESMLSTTSRLMHHMGRIFRENGIAPANPAGIRVDSKRRKKLMEKRMVMGHKADDHEEYKMEIKI